MKKMSILAIAATALLVSCDPKEKNPNNNVTPKPKTKTDLMTAGKWQMTAGAITYTVLGQTNTDDFFKDLEACEKDNFILFHADGKATTDEGTTKCDSTDDQSTTSTWAFYDNETKVIFTEDGTSDTADIEELTESVLKISYSETDSMYSYKNVMTFGRIN